MIIRGILDRSLSNQICVRGFARIKELARISKADKSYQRALRDKQKKDISNFLTEEEFLFFPEVILSLKLKYDLTKPKAKTSKTPTQLIESRKTFNSNVHKISIKPIIKKNNKVFDVSETNEITIVEIHIDDGELNQLISDDKHPFHRIDGNHRLSAAEQIEGGDRINRMNIPFCIVLFEEITQEKFDPKQEKNIEITEDKGKKFERVVFYNINSKSEPLTLEENLKVIIDDKENFKNEEIERIFGKSGVLVRKLIDKINKDHFNDINHLIENNLRNLGRTIFEAIEEKLEKEDEDNKVSRVFESLKAVEQDYKSEKKLKNNSSEGLFTAFLYYHITDKVKYSFFKDWVLNNHIFDIKEAKYQTLIEIFDKVSDKQVKVFVAMPFFSDAEIETYNQAYKRVIDEIKKSNESLNINLYEIMQHKGQTYNINNKMIEQINNCTMFIADISTANANVAFELGYAKNADKPIIIVKRNDDKTNIPFDYAQDMHHCYNEKAIHTLEKIALQNIEEILQEKGLIFTGGKNEK